MGAPQREESLELSNSSAQRERIRRIAERGPTGRLRHCLTVGAEIHGQVDENELRTRLGGLVDRRPALGSVFTDRGTHRLAGGSPVFRRQAISAPDAASRWRITRDIAAFEAQRPFAPGEHPLVRGLLLSPEADRHLLVLTIDQLVGDSWSANLVVRDLFGDEGARSVREPDGYAAVWREREEWLADPEGVSAVERRRHHLADATPRWPIPANPDLEALSVAEEFVALDDSVTDALRVRVREAHGSLLAVAAMALVLSIVEDPDQPLALLSTLAGRETPAEQEVVGWFAGDGVIRLPARRGTVREYATALRTEIFAALGAQRVPYELLSDALPDEPAAGPTCALVFLPRELSGGRPAEQRLGAAAVSRTAISICPTSADIDFFLIEDAPPMSSAPPAALTVGASTGRDVTDAETISRLLQRWIATLTALAGLPWSSTPITGVVGPVAGGLVSSGAGG